MRPIPAVLLLLIATIIGTVFGVVRYARIRTSALAWIVSRGGTWEHAPGRLDPAWKRLQWALTIRRAVLDHDPCAPPTEALKLGQLRSLHELQELSLARCSLSDVELRELRGLKRLRKLNLGDTSFAELGLKRTPQRVAVGAPTVVLQVSAADLDALQGLPLDELHLGGRDITGPMLPHLAGLPLRKLDLSNTKLGDDDLHYLPRLPLDELDLSGTNVTDVGLDELSRHGIKRLRLGRTRITDRGIPKLVPLSLELLDLQKTGITDASVPELMKMRLQVLSVDGTFVTLRGVRILVTHPSLRRLELGIPQLAGAYSVEEATRALSTSALEVTGVQTAFPPFCP